MDIFGLFLVAIGIFALFGALFNWDWFMNSRRARLFVRLLSRNGARIFYAVIGLSLVVLGLLGTLGIIDLSS